MLPIQHYACFPIAVNFYDIRMHEHKYGKKQKIIGNLIDKDILLSPNQLTNNKDLLTRADEPWQNKYNIKQYGMDNIYITET